MPVPHASTTPALPSRYKPVIVFEGFAYILTWVLLLWGYGVAQMKVLILLLLDLHLFFLFFTVSSI